MPPPSSPQQSSPLPHYASQRGPPPPPFSTGRDLPGLVGPPRPSSNMSISSLMGGFESAAASRQSQSHYSPPSSTTAPSPSMNSMQPPSPRRNLVGGGRMEYSQYRRPETPDQYPPVSRPADRPAYTSGSPPRSFAAPPTASPDAQRQSLGPSSQPYKPGPLQTSNPYHHQPSRSEPSSADPRPGASSAPPRPNSQPSHPPSSTNQGESRDMYDAASARRAFFGQSEEERRAAQDHVYQGRPGVSNPGDTSRLDTGGRERPSTVQPLSHSIFDAPDRQRAGIPQPQPATSQPPRSLFWHPQPRSHATGETAQHHIEESRDPYQHGARSTPGALSGPMMGINRSATGTHVSAADNHQRFPLAHDPARRVAEQYQSPPTSDPSSMDRRRNDQAGHQQAHNGYAPRSSSYEYHPKPQGEEMQKSRSFLGVSPEARRTGRASPLPQAVQGAQAQPVVPGGDPSIKNEFGRMFSGLGSGLVSAPHGSATPTRGSPFPQNREAMAHGDSGDLDPLGRTGSRGARRSRKIKDEEGRVESDSNDGRITPSLAGQRNSKRPKHNHPGHHHHHLYSHQYVHPDLDKDLRLIVSSHHHRPEEEQNMAIATQQASTTPTSFSKVNGVQGQNIPSIVPPAHHHHHHHHAPHPPHHHHHHHHAPRVTSVPPIPATKPIVEVNSQAVLEKVKDLPRYHLGSVVYEATTAPPPSKNTSIDDRYGFRTIPSALPDYTGKENCTLTVRIPRYYLSERQRDVIVVSRQLWGSEIYTHDSDVVGAAIHSGWIRGAWPEDVDVNMLDPRINGGSEAPSEADPSQPLVSKPGHPAPPPTGFDAHVTVTILPCLTEYKGSVCYGIKSHTRRQHEGCSYKIDRVEWVDDELTKRGEERSGAARRERMAAAQSLVALLTSGGGRHSNGTDGDVSQGMRMGQAQAVA